MKLVNNWFLPDWDNHYHKQMKGGVYQKNKEI